ncbi:MAG: DUF192 domain-containing protein [Holophagaceae bacterium]|nr:DUF192 domain-containing protein [Holophagaceae bacterium]
MQRFIRPALLGSLSSLAVFGAGSGTVAAKGHRFLAEVAATPREQQKGLMFRQSLAKDRCMIFVYDEDGSHGIWMKNCLISLDVVWISADGKVVEMAERVPPCSPMRGDDCPTYGGTVPARHFIEFAVGTIKSIGLKKGDRIGWDLKLDDGTPVVGGAPIPPEKTATKTKRRPK